MLLRLAFHEYTVNSLKEPSATWHFSTPPFMLDEVQIKEKCTTTIRYSAALNKKAKNK